MTEKSKEELSADIEIEIQALGANLGGELKIIRFWLFGIFVLGIIALVHFW